MAKDSPNRSLVSPTLGDAQEAKCGPRNDAGHFLVVGIGASAGGLDACRKLLRALPIDHGMVFILVQHSDPNHESMMVGLLAGHTRMTVREAVDGLPIEREHLYVIPPGTYPSVSNGKLRLSTPLARHGARLPFDFLLHSLAEEFASRTVCVILSGTGADGSLGLRTVAEVGGLIIAQDPKDAGYDGMPRSAISTGAVDLVLAADEIPEALMEQTRNTVVARATVASKHDGSGSQARKVFSEMIELLRTETVHDFTLYKQGTLQRRIERRMAMAAIEVGGVDRYLEVLRRSPAERDSLAKDLLINVTSFFRDTHVFDLLAQKIIPELVSSQQPEHPMRVWVAGCSTGEETYSLAMLFQEEIATDGRNVKLQVFASDADQDAVASAREGLYPETISTVVTAPRLARFFSKEGHAYRVSPELRSTVIFSVQDVLTDPPFSRLDMVSCRNLLIYLRPEAQAKVISAFHFALRRGGVLLLGSAETVGKLEDRFAAISEAERLFRRVGQGRAGDFGFSSGARAGVTIPPRLGRDPAPSSRDALADLCRRLVIDAYAPAAVLVSRNYGCLFSLGPIHRYLRIAPGHPAHDLLAVTPEELRNTLRQALRRAELERAHVVVPGCRIGNDEREFSFTIAIHPVATETEPMMLVCFIDEPALDVKRNRHPPMGRPTPKLAHLRHELDETRTQLQGAIRSLEISSEEQKAINQEAWSVNEENQSANEELVTSKEELQSLNEELTALNGQLRETLERQRTTSNDLQNVLFSTNVATLFLDANLNIRFFTPATKAFFNVILSDVGRPLADLRSLAADNTLLSDARITLDTLVPIELEIETENGAWYVRRILPYRTRDSGVEGVVITFADVTERRRAAGVVEAAKQLAEHANIAKSRFLAAASHDLRQPLQTFALIQSMLAKTVERELEQQLVAKLDQTLRAMSGVLDTLLDINQIETGSIGPTMSSFSVKDLLYRLKDDVDYLSPNATVAVHVVLSSLCIRSDPHLLEQMTRNLLSNSLKYTTRGKVLIGCRRRGDVVSIEFWDTGIGIRDDQLEAIFEEYHQIGNATRQRSQGFGLGLSIVRRLGDLLGHRVSVRSKAGKGSVFAIEAKLAASEISESRSRQPTPFERFGASERRVVAEKSILLIEDDLGERELLSTLLKSANYTVASAPDGVAALELVTRKNLRPDLILADYNLPNGMTGLEAASKLRAQLKSATPVVILTGDITTHTLQETVDQNCVQLNKPATYDEIIEVIRRLLKSTDASSKQYAESPVQRPAEPEPVIFVIDDDKDVREGLRRVLEEDGWAVKDYATSEAFLEAYRPGRAGCMLIDVHLPGMSGLELLKRLNDAGHAHPAIMITGHSDVSMAVQAMKAGASDFIEKPIGRDELLASVRRALDQTHDVRRLEAWRNTAAKQVATLTLREREIMKRVLAGRSNKNIAADLRLSQRTVENHRASVMKKTGSKSLPALARLALAAEWLGSGDSSFAPAELSRVGSIR
jgi:two-component system CheB/CheR fusion protein